MAMSFTAEQLIKNIDHDTSVCTSLLKVLSEEQEALKNREVDAVSALLDKKVPLLEQLENSAKLRQAWASAANQKNDETGWQTMIAELGVSSIRESWQALKTLYADVRQQNEVNGKLLSRHQQTVTRLLDVMRGKTASPNLYNASGYASSKAQSNLFGEA